MSRMRLAFMLLLILTIVLQLVHLWMDYENRIEAGRFKKAMADSQAFILAVIGDTSLDKDGKPVKTLIGRIAEVDQHVTDIRNDVHGKLDIAVGDIKDFTQEGRDRIAKNSDNIQDTKSAVEALSKKMDDVVKYAEQSKVASQVTRYHASVVQRRIEQRLPKPTPKPWFHIP